MHSLNLSIRNGLLRTAANTSLLNSSRAYAEQPSSASRNAAGLNKSNQSNASASSSSQKEHATHRSTTSQQQPTNKNTEQNRKPAAETGSDSATADESNNKESFVLQKDAGWFTRILKGAPGGAPHAGGGDIGHGGGSTGAGGPGAHSAHSMLGTKKVVYELQFHKIYPDAVDKYLQAYGRLVDYTKHTENNMNLQLVGSWLVQTGGDQDQVVNLWKHANGYTGMEGDEQVLNPYRNNNNDSEGGQLTRDYARFLRKRQNQYLLAFSFWGDPTTKVRQGANLYEMRSYSLRPGTMVDWANHWARAIHIRKKDSAPVGGFFSQVGHMYKVYHMWSYVDLEDRRQSRDHAWRYPGWDECVQATVPLIKDMQSRLMYATPFSPLQ